MFAIVFFVIVFFAIFFVIVFSEVDRVGVLHDRKRVYKGVESRIVGEGGPEGVIVAKHVLQESPRRALRELIIIANLVEATWGLNA